MPAAASSHTNTGVASSHSTDTDFNDGTTFGNVSEITGSGDSAVVALNATNLTFDTVGQLQHNTTAIQNASVTVAGAAGADGQASGGFGGSGGLGGYAAGYLNVSGADQVDIFVGGQGSGTTGGFNGGGDGGSGDNDADGGAGGGAADIRVDNATLDGREIVGAGGAGGGGGEGSSNNNGGAGGAGGANTGQDGSDGGNNAGSGGGGGDQSSGGAGGTSTDGTNGNAGSSASGGTGASESASGGAGGGGGGGYFGGGGGASGGTDEAGGGGGGGSNYVGGVDPVVDNNRGANNGDGQVTFEWIEATGYISSNHTVDDPVDGFANITTLNNATVTVVWEEHDGSSWSAVNSTTITSTGNHTANLSAATHSTLRMRMTYEITGESPSAELNEEGITFENTPPTPSDESPTGGPELNQETVTISLNVSDTDFPSSQGDNVTVDIYHNPPESSESIIHTESVQSNSTVTVDIQPVLGGEHSWRADLNDSYGGTNSTGPHNFSVPGALQIYNESQPETLIDSRDINVTIYDLEGDEIFERSTTDGNLSTSGLPLNTPLVFAFTVDGYHDRTLILRTAFEQQSAYLLNDTVTSVSPTFLVEDETGQYDPTSSRVFIERGLQINGSTEYRTIAAEEVGTDGYTETLEMGVRYRMTVENEDGDRRVLGKFSATDSADYVLTVEEIVFDQSREQDAISWNFTHTVENEGEPSESQTVTFAFQDEDDRTEDLEVVIFERGNASNEIHNQTHPGPHGTIVITETLSSNQFDKEWEVEWTAERNPTFSGSSIVGPKGTVPIPLDDHWKHVVSIGLILVVAGLGSQINAQAVGVAVASVSGMLWYIGFLPSAVTGGVIAVGFLIPALVIMRQRGVGV